MDSTPSSVLSVTAKNDAMVQRNTIGASGLGNITIASGTQEMGGIGRISSKGANTKSRMERFHPMSRPRGIPSSDHAKAWTMRQTLAAMSVYQAKPQMPYPHLDSSPGLYVSAPRGGSVNSRKTASGLSSFSMRGSSKR